LLAHAPPAAAIFLFSAIVLLAVFAPNWPQLLFVVSAPFFGNIGLWFLPPLVAPLIWGSRRAIFVSLGALLAFAGSALGGNRLVAGFLDIGTPDSNGAIAIERLNRPLPFASPLAKFNEYGTEGTLAADFVADLEHVLTLFWPLIEQPHALFEVAAWAIGVALMLGIIQGFRVFGQAPAVLPSSILDLLGMTVALLAASLWLAIAHWTVLPLLGAPITASAQWEIFVHAMRSLTVAVFVAIIVRFLPPLAEE